MARLIDVDAIPFRDELKRLSVLDHDKYITAETLEYMLEHAPTVDAIPVSLIEEHIRSYRRRAAAARGKSVEDDENAAVLDEIAWALKYVIQDWRERNETD